MENKNPTSNIQGAGEFKSPIFEEPKSRMAPFDSSTRLDHSYKTEAEMHATQYASHLEGVSGASLGSFIDHAEGFSLAACDGFGRHQLDSDADAHLSANVGDDLFLHLGALFRAGLVDLFLPLHLYG